MNWNTLLQQLADQGGEFRLGEIHGHLCGRLVGGHVLVGSSGQRIVENLLNIQSGESPELIGQMVDLMQQSYRQLETSTFGFELLLPDDDWALASRLESLADWCNGFLEGLGHTLAASELSKDAEMREILVDLAEIGNLSLEVDESNENEAYYTELYEYVRVAVMNLYALFRASAQDEAEDAPERH